MCWYKVIRMYGLLLSQIDKNKNTYRTGANYCMVYFLRVLCENTIACMRLFTASRTCNVGPLAVIANVQ